MTEPADTPLLYSGEQLWNLTEGLRLRMFKATLFLAALLVLPAVLMIVTVDKDIGIRLALLAVVGTLCALGAAEAGWCYRRLREQQWWVLLPALLAASVLVIGGARQNATFIVIGTAMVGTPAIIEITSAMTAGSIIALGYVISILVGQQNLLVDGSAGDLAAVISLLVAIYAAHRAAELVTMVVADVNRDAKEATMQIAEPAPSPGRGRFVAAHMSTPTTSVSARVIAQEATDHVPDDVLGRLSEHDLTPAERRVAYLAGDGLSQKRIAELLGKSTKTVSNQLRSIKDKLDVETHAELTAKIRRLLALPLGQSTPEARMHPGQERAPSRDA